MKTMNKYVEYAVVFAREVGVEDFVNTESIAKKHGLSLQLLEQVARKMGAAGLTVSKKGHGGGHALHEDFVKGGVTLYSVMDAMGHLPGTSDPYLCRLYREYRNALGEIYVRAPA